MSTDTAEEEQDISTFLKSWAWKREHRSVQPRQRAQCTRSENRTVSPVCQCRPDKVRFQRPYTHRLQVNDEELSLTIPQKPFKAEGFASTVWDSSIVVAKYFEKLSHALPGKKCLDLSAGCGLVGIVLAKLGASVTATDIGPNVDFLRTSCKMNGDLNINVVEHFWGSAFKGEKDFDFIIGCDLMYVEDAVKDLVRSLVNLSSQKTNIIIAYGRNRQAESNFLERCSPSFTVQDTPKSELDSLYQCSDVRMLRLRRK